jgi:NADP-reducing hydrogenase subunit HndB
MAEKIKSVAELQALRDQAREDLDLRSGAKSMQRNVHMGTCGIAAGARDVLADLATELGRLGVKFVTLRQSGCAGLCSHEPMLTLTDKSGAEFRYGKLDRQRVLEIVREHVVGGHPVGPYLIGI